MRTEERLLLVRAKVLLECVDTAPLQDQADLIIKEVEAILTLPEPIKEREVSGKIISTDDACNWNLTVAALKDYDHVYVNGIRYTEFQPDINTQYLLDQVARLTAENAMLKEKWLAQPEQEPVAWCQMVEGNVQDLLTSFEMKDWLYDKSWIPLYLAPPKREPLSEATINYYLERLGSHFKWDDGFEAGVKWAEKAHGIGVDDES